MPARSTDIVSVVYPAGVPRSSAASARAEQRFIERVSPTVDNGRFPAKRTVGDVVRVEADIFTDGHDSIAAVVVSKRAVMA